MDDSNMRYLILFLLLISNFCFASNVTCYSYSKKIYQGKGKDFILEEGIVAFTEIKTHHLILIMGDCVIQDV